MSQRRRQPVHVRRVADRFIERHEPEAVATVRGLRIAARVHHVHLRGDLVVGTEPGLRQQRQRIVGVVVDEKLRSADGELVECTPDAVVGTRLGEVVAAAVPSRFCSSSIMWTASVTLSTSSPYTSTLALHRRRVWLVVEVCGLLDDRSELAEVGQSAVNHSRRGWFWSEPSWSRCPPHAEPAFRLGVADPSENLENLSRPLHCAASRRGLRGSPAAV